MAYCTQCGNLLREGASFCTQCGAKVRKTQTTTPRSSTPVSLRSRSYSQRSREIQDIKPKSSSRTPIVFQTKQPNTKEKEEPKVENVNE